MLMVVNKEEFANSLSHGIGAVIFLAAAPVLFSQFSGKDTVMWPVVVYLFCLFMTYLTSTIYHSFTDDHYKKILRILDHISIFLLIGGTFTPIVVYNMGNWNGWPFLSVFWIAMAGGIIFKIFYTGKHKLISTLIYVGIAWVGAVFLWPLVKNMPRQVALFLIIGGLFYTGGTVFYMQKKMKFHHAWWHMFVLAGSLSHFIAVYVSLQG
jgi:hemolysin III